MSFWNKLPIEVKTALNLNVFKSHLEIFKGRTKALGIYGSGNFWDISDEIVNRIQVKQVLLSRLQYLLHTKNRNGLWKVEVIFEKRIRHTFLKDNPFVARNRFININ